MAPLRQPEYNRTGRDGRMCHRHVDDTLIGECRQRINNGNNNNNSSDYNNIISWGDDQWRMLCGAIVPITPAHRLYAFDDSQNHVANCNYGYPFPLSSHVAVVTFDPSNSSPWKHITRRVH